MKLYIINYLMLKVKDLMKIAICFFGECTFLDRFMIQNFIRCIVVPFQKYVPEKVEFFYIFHSYMDEKVLGIIEMMKTFFPFTVLTLHNKEFVRRDVQDDNVSLYLQDYSLQRVKRMWKRCMLSLDLVVCSRIDLLFCRPLSASDVEAMFVHKNHLFVVDASSLEQCFVVGDPFVMNLYTDRLHYVEDHGTDFSLVDLIQIHPMIKNITLSTVIVRILSDASVHPHDSQRSPYLNDLIKSSCTRIYLRKMNSKMKTDLSKTTNEA